MKFKYILLGHNCFNSFSYLLPLSTMLEPWNTFNSFHSSHLCYCGRIQLFTLLIFIILNLLYNFLLLYIISLKALLLLSYPIDFHLY